MFICQKCGIITKPREPQTLKVVEVRKKVYDLGFDEEDECQRFSEGEEIVKEIAICLECAKPSELDFKVVH